MTVLIELALGLLISYFLIYWISKLLAVIATTIKIAWLVLIAGCVSILYFFLKGSWLNIFVVGVCGVLYVILVIKIFAVTAIRKSAKKFNKADYNDDIRMAYACLYTFLVFGSLYVNVSYIFIVLLGEVPLEEYKEMGILTGFATSQIGLGPIKWFLLALALISLYRAYKAVDDVDTDYTIKEKKHVSPPPDTTVLDYYAQVLGIKIAPKDNSVDAIREALRDYFSIIVEDEKKRDSLVEAILDAAAFETTDYEELLEDLSNSSGIDSKELLTYLPQLGG